MSLLIICLQLAFWSPNTSAILAEIPKNHDYFYSHCTIDYNADQETVEISLKLDIDNLEEVIEAQGMGSLLLGEENEAPLADEYLSRYFLEHLKLHINGKPVSITYFGKEPKLDVMWCYLEVTDVSSISTLEIENTLFFERFDIQTHIILARILGKRQQDMLNKDKPSAVFEF